MEARRRHSAGSGWIGMAVVLAAVGAVHAQESASSKAGSPDVEARLQKLEEQNRQLLEQYQSLARKEVQGRIEAEKDRRDADRRYAELETRFRQMRSSIGGETEPNRRTDVGDERNPPRPGPSLSRPEEREEPDAPKGPWLQGRLEDGFSLETANEEYLLRFHVLDQTDFKVFTPNNQEPARSGLYIPRVRLYLEGRLTKPFEYEISLQRSVEGNWDLLDANLNFNRDERFQILFGRTLTPYSYDWYDHLEQYFLTPERGLFPLNYGLARQAGLLAHGFLFDDRLQYAIGGFDGHLLNLADSNTSREAVGYVNARPFLRDESRPKLRNLNLGGSIFAGRQVIPEDPLPLRTSLQSSENDEAARSATAIFLDFGPTTQYFGTRQGGALHMAYYQGGLTVEAEYQQGKFGYIRQGLAQPVAVPVVGFHAGMGYFLTGEQIESRTAVQPLRPFDLTKGSWGPGAFEAFARYSQLHLGHEIFDAGLADENAWSNNAHLTDIGLNWYLTQYVKFYFDWQHLFTGKEVLINPRTNLFSRDNDLFWIRCQVYF